jgi:hypothetical protein
MLPPSWIVVAKPGDPTARAVLTRCSITSSRLTAGGPENTVAGTAARPARRAGSGALLSECWNDAFTGAAAVVASHPATSTNGSSELAVRPRDLRPMAVLPV